MGINLKLVMIALFAVITISIVKKAGAYDYTFTPSYIRIDKTVDKDQAKQIAAMVYSVYETIDINRQPLKGIQKSIEKDVEHALKSFPYVKTRVVSRTRDIDEKTKLIEVKVAWFNVMDKMAYSMEMGWATNKMKKDVNL